jgi:polysaccharide export outer membrane protein
MRLSPFAHRITMVSCVVLLLILWGGKLQAQFVAPAPFGSPGLNTPRALTTDPEILYPAHREIQLMAGDGVRITIYGASPAFEAPATVSLDGTIHIPLAGTLKVEGLSLTEAEAMIAARMEQLEMYRNAQVSVQLVAAPGHVVTLMGSLHGSVIIASKKRLFDVLSGAGGGAGGGGGSGGVSLTTSPIVTIERPGVPEPIVVDLGSDPVHSSAANIPIFAGDTITTGDVGSYYVVGAVKTPGVQKLNGTLPTTVMQALAVSGGVVYASKQNHTKLIRTVGSERSVVEIQLKEVLAGRAPDPILQADDILVVPPDHVKAFFTSGAFTGILSIVLTAIALTRY